MGQKPFEAVVAEHGPMVLRVCRAVAGPDAAEDAWSETFLAAMRAYHGLRAGSNIESWLVTIAHRKAIDRLRAEARQPAAVSDIPERPVLDGIPGGWEGDLHEAIRALPLKQRQAVAYHHIAGLPYADVAKLVGGSADAARRAASDGVATLRSMYQEDHR